MKIVMAGSLSMFVDNVRSLCGHGHKPELLIFPAEKNTNELKKLFKPCKVPMIVTDDIHSLSGDLAKIKPDLLICIGYPEILKNKILSVPRLGAINVHGSSLPFYRGRHPLNWALINGEKEIGMTVHFMNEGIDTGDIILQDFVKVQRDDDLVSVDKRLRELSCKMLLAAIAQIESGSVYHRTQTPGGGSYLPRRTPADSRLDLGQTSVKAHSFINALVDPMPNAFLSSGKKEIRIKRSFRGSQSGEVLARTTDGRYVVATGDGVILVKTDRVIAVGSVLR